MRKICVKKPALKQENVLVTICPEDKDRYRFGFNRQEKVNKWAGIGNFMEFSERGYDSRIGRFLRVDPIAHKYPHNSTYAFAENDVIACIDLEGKERLNMVTEGSPSLGTPGKAKITISMQYQTVTEGPGAVSENFRPDPKLFHNQFARGNTTLYMTTLPTRNAEGVFLSGQQEKLAAKAKEGNQKARQGLIDAGVTYFEVDIAYDYTMDVKIGTSFNTAWKWISGDIQGRGMQYNTLTIGQAEGARDERLYKFKAQAIHSFKKDYKSGGTSTNSSIGYGNLNLTSVKEATVGYGDGNIEYRYGSPSMRSVHEAGHNQAESFIHNTGDYEYDQSGLQNNSLPQPSEKNTKQIINDQLNRSTLPQ